MGMSADDVGDTLTQEPVGHVDLACDRTDGVFYAPVHEGDDGIWSRIPGQLLVVFLDAWLVLDLLHRLVKVVPEGGFDMVLDLLFRLSCTCQEHGSGDGLCRLDAFHAVMRRDGGFLGHLHDVVKAFPAKAHGTDPHPAAVAGAVVLDRPVVVLQPPLERVPEACCRILLAPGPKGLGVRFLMQQCIGNGDGQHAVVGEGAIGTKQLEALFWGFFHKFKAGAGDVADDCSDDSMNPVVLFFHRGVS